MKSSTWVGWLIICECQPSDFEDVMSLAATMTEFVSVNEPETTHFEWSCSPDHLSVHLYERYSNSTQALAHMTAFAEQFGAKFMSLLKPTSVIVYGFPTAELKSQLEALSPQFTECFAGFHR